MGEGVEIVTLFDNLPAIITALREGAKVAVRQVAAEVTVEANMSAPYAEGVLAASGYYAASDVSTYGAAVGAATGIDDRDMLEEVEHPESETEAVIAYAASYAIFVHDGTRYVGARPWLTQALEGASGRVTQKIASLVGKAIASVL